MSIFHAIWIKITYTATAFLIAVGLVSSPTPGVISPEATSTVQIAVATPQAVQEATKEPQKTDSPEPAINISPVLSPTPIAPTIPPVIIYIPMTDQPKNEAPVTGAAAPHVAVKTLTVITNISPRELDANQALIQGGRATFYVIAKEDDTEIEGLEVSFAAPDFDVVTSTTYPIGRVIQDDPVIHLGARFVYAPTASSTTQTLTFSAPGYPNTTVDLKLGGR